MLGVSPEYVKQLAFGLRNPVELPSFLENMIMYAVIISGGKQYKIKLPASSILAGKRRFPFKFFKIYRAEHYHRQDQARASDMKSEHQRQAAEKLN